MRRCCICGAKVLHRNQSQKIDTCSPQCRSAKQHGRTLAEQLALEADAIEWAPAPFEELLHGRARRSATL